MPIAAASTAATTMPSSTEMLAMKPRAKRAMSRIAASEIAEMPIGPGGA